MTCLTFTKIDINYSESGVIFSICDCSLNKRHSFWGLSREEATKLIKRLQHIEKLTWRQLASLSRKNGLTSETSGSDSFNMISEQDSSGQQIVGERYYFHFRVEETDLFRVFGYQKNQFFCITHIDPDGKMHHS